MNPPPRCQVAGCPHPATTFLPAAPAGLPSLTEVAGAPLRACCRTHREVVSNRYAAAVDWALLREHVEDGSPVREVLRQICRRLQGMDTPWTRSLYRSLDCRPGAG